MRTSIPAITVGKAQVIVKGWIVALGIFFGSDSLAQGNGVTESLGAEADFDRKTTLVSGVGDCGELVCFEETAVEGQLGESSSVEESQSERDIVNLPEYGPEPDKSERVDSIPANERVKDYVTEGGLSEEGQTELPGEVSSSETNDVGPEQGVRPGLFVVDEGAAERALERSLVLLDALLLQPRKMDVGIDFSYSVDSRLGSSLIAVTDQESNETNDFIGVIEEENKTINTSLDLRVGLPGDSQLNLAIPFANTSSSSLVRLEGAVVEAQRDDASQNGDFTLSYIKTVFTEKGRRPDLIAGIAYSNGGGSGGSDVTISLNATKRQDPLVFTGSFSVTQSQEQDGISAGSSRSWSVGTLLAASPYTSLQFSFDHTVVGNSAIDGVKISGSGQEIANANLGVASVIGQRLFLNGNLAIGLSELSSDYVLSIGLSRRLSF
jgi:hypothetical protein